MSRSCRSRYVTVVVVVVIVVVATNVSKNVQEIWTKKMINIIGCPRTKEHQEHQEQNV